MSVQAALRCGRAAWLQRMRDTVTITRVTARTWGPITLTYVETTATLYTGPAYVQPLNLGQREVQAGEREVAIRSFDVVLPWSAAGVEFAENDQCAVDSCEDTRLAGRVLTVVGVARGGQRLNRRLPAEDRD